MTLNIEKLHGKTLANKSLIMKIIQFSTAKPLPTKTMFNKGNTAPIHVTSGFLSIPGFNIKRPKHVSESEHHTSKNGSYKPFPKHLEKSISTTAHFFLSTAFRE